MVKDVNKETITSALNRHHDLLEQQFVSALDGIETTVSALKSEAAFACTSKRLREAVEHADAVLVQALSHIVEDEAARGFDEGALDSVARAEFDADALEEDAEDEALTAFEVADGTEDAPVADDDIAVEPSQPFGDEIVEGSDTESMAADMEPSEGSEGFGDVSIEDGVLQHDDVSDLEAAVTHEFANDTEDDAPKDDDSDYGSYLGATMQSVEY